MSGLLDPPDHTPERITLIKFNAKGDAWPVNDKNEGVELVEISSTLPLVVVTWVENGQAYDIRTDYDRIWPYMEEALDMYDLLLTLAPERLHEQLISALNPYRMDLV